MTIKKLTAMPYAQAHVEIRENATTLFSYVTRVAEIDNDWLTIYGLYSATTRRHIGAFVKEYAGIGYQIAKMLYNDGYRYNIKTGEIKEIG